MFQTEWLNYAALVLTVLFIAWTGYMVNSIDWDKLEREVRNAKRKY